MGTFTTKLSLGDRAFGVEGSLDFWVRELTVGQVRPTLTAPKSREYSDETCYKEEYMCNETGVGSGTIWTYGKNIFASRAEAERSVIEHQQMAYKERAIRDAYEAEKKTRRKREELETLARLKEKYEAEVVR